MGALLVGCSGDDASEGDVDFVQREGSRLVKVQSVGLAAFGPINPHTATPSVAAAAFGEPPSAEESGRLCRRRWAELGLRLDFRAPRGQNPCGATAGIERAVVGGPAAAEAGWRTAEGIRPGMSVAAARRIYPEARRAGRRLVLVRGPAGDSGERLTVLAVKTRAGEVAEMTFPIGAGSDSRG